MRKASTGSSFSSAGFVEKIRVKPWLPFGVNMLNMMWLRSMAHIPFDTKSGDSRDVLFTVTSSFIVLPTFSCTTSAWHSVVYCVAMTIFLPLSLSPYSTSHATAASISFLWMLSARWHSAIVKYWEKESNISFVSSSGSSAIYLLFDDSI